jgi:hypothetical protein
LSSGRVRAAFRLGVVVAATLAPAVLLAGEEDRLNWVMGDEAFRYDLTEDENARVSPDPGLTPVLEKTRLLSQADFERARRLQGEVRSPSDLIWFYALFLPDGEYGAKGGTYPINEHWKLGWPQGELNVTGTDEVKRPAPGKVTLKAVVEFFQEKVAAGTTPPTVAWMAKGSTLTVERTLVENPKDKKKMIVEARFDLAFKRQNGDKVESIHQAGKIAFAGRVDMAKKEFLGEVNAAIKRGSAFLEEKLAKRISEYRPLRPPPGQALGMVALPTFALLRSGVPPAQLKDAFDYMATLEWKEVYSVSLYVMCLEARSVRREEVPATAGGRTVARFRKDALPKQDKAEILRAAKWLVAVRKHGEGWWSYFGNPGEALDGEEPRAKGTGEKKNPNAPNAADEGYPADASGNAVARGDRSNSQFATLALHAAATSDCPFDPAVWKEIVEELAKAEEQEGPATSLKDVEWTAATPQGIAPDGGPDPFQPNATRSREVRIKDYGEGARARGWAYAMGRHSGDGSGYGSMSGAGLSSAAVAREGLRRAGKLDADLELKTRTEIRDGVAWYLRNWTVDHNPNNGGWYYYYLYSVEKAMETAGVEKLGAHEWWREGCAQLLALEDAGKAGSWNGKNLEDTSFALLFLNRATLPATIVTQDNVKIATGERDPSVWDQVFVEGTGNVGVRQVFYALETATPDLVKDRLKIAEKAFEVLDEERRPRLVPDLLRLLALKDKEIHRFAARALRIATGTDDEAKVRVFYGRWQALAKACEERDYTAIASMRALFKDADSTIALKRTICVALTRLRAIEALGDLIAELADKDPSYRRQVATAIVQLAGGEKVPYDPAGPDADRAKQQAAWADWWKKSQTPLVVAEEARRQVEALAEDGTRGAAQKKLLALGTSAVRALIDGLLEPRTKPHAHALLISITKQNLGKETGPWLEWWEKQKKG